MSDSHTGKRILAEWNGEPRSSAIADILPCNGSRNWATQMADLRPISSSELLFQAADAIWLALDEVDWQQAFDSHPRLGEREAPAAAEQSLRWSSSEQSMVAEDIMRAAALTEANKAYELRFGRIFLLCAAGKRTPEVLSSLRSRLDNDDETELRVAVEQQRRITQLRLRKWLSLPSASCDEV